jgi:hypothetical protein
MVRIVISILFLACAVIVPRNFTSAEVKRKGAEPLKIRIVSLKQDQRIHGRITIEARVNYPEEVKDVEFYFQESGAEDRYGWFDYSPPYFWGGDGETFDTTLLVDGPASAVAFAMPNDKDAAVVGHRVEVIIDNGKPKVKILTPNDGEVVAGNFVIRVEADDPKGLAKKAAIHTVFLYLDGGLVRRMTSPPFHAELDTCLLLPGLHSLRAVAEDTEYMTSADTVIITTGERVPE